ncbi:hypothetical protein R1flu_002315 [Riccia fluitans]|uniref:Uncharacterized protein n=1 Tax=Riccia fluitans TaxID=41844 RepID=A0ABD1Y5T0_9MARC
MVSIVHSIGVRGGSLKEYSAVNRRNCWQRSDVLYGVCPAHLEFSTQYVDGKQRLLQGRKLRRSKSLRPGRVSGVSFPVLGYHNRDGISGRGRGNQLIARKPLMSEKSKLDEKQRWPCFRRSRSRGRVCSSRFSAASVTSVEERERQSKPRYSHVWTSCQRNFIAAAAVAGMSISLCSSALASPAVAETTSIPKYLQEDVEIQLVFQLEEEIKAQRDWLEDIGQPLSQWSIDDHIKQKIFVDGEGKADRKLDESGRIMKMHNVDSIVVPLFRPSAVAARKERTISSQDKPQSKQVAKTPSAKSTTTTALTSADAPELVAVTAVPLASVLSSAGGSVASMGGAAVATAMSTSPVPGAGLLARIMMHFSGGGLAGAMGATIVYPLDTVKTRMQAQSSKDGEKPHYKDEMDCLRQVVSEEGIGSLYSGLIPQLIGIAPEKAIKLTVNEILLEMLESKMPGVGVVLLELIAGSGGGFSQVVFTNPMEAVKVRLQTQPKDSNAKNMWQVVKELGLQGLYNGSSVTLARDVPSTAIFFAVYTFIRQMYPDQSFMAGCLAAIPATLVVTPMDVVKTRMQMEKSQSEDQYENAWQCFVQILQKEGPRALFKGSGARVLKTSPQFGITLMLYNMLCHLQ